MRYRHQVQIKRCAIELLMKTASARTSFPAVFSGPTKLDLLKNRIIELLKTNKAGFYPDSVDTLGKEFVNVLGNTLWYIDGHHHIFNNRGACPIPSFFAPFSGFNIPELSKHRKRVINNLKAELLENHSSDLFKIACHPYMKTTKATNPWFLIKENVLRLADSLRKYSSYLKKQVDRVQIGHKKVQIMDNYECEVYDSCEDIKNPYRERCFSLHTNLTECSFYDPVFLNEHAPDEHRRRYDYLQALVFPCETVCFSHVSAREHLHFVWKIDPNEDETMLLQKMKTSVRR